MWEYEWEYGCVCEYKWVWVKECEYEWECGCVCEYKWVWVKECECESERKCVENMKGIRIERRKHIQWAMGPWSQLEEHRPFHLMEVGGDVHMKPLPIGQAWCWPDVENLLLACCWSDVSLMWVTQNRGFGLILQFFKPQFGLFSQQLRSLL